MPQRDAHAGLISAVRNINVRSVRSVCAVTDGAEDELGEGVAGRLPMTASQKKTKNKLVEEDSLTQLSLVAVSHDRIVSSVVSATAPCMIIAQGKHQVKLKTTVYRVIKAKGGRRARFHPSPGGHRLGLLAEGRDGQNCASSCRRRYRSAGRRHRPRCRRLSLCYQPPLSP